MCLNDLGLLMKRKYFSLICLSETWLTEVDDCEVQLSGYSIIRRNRSIIGKGRGGGVAIFVASELSTVRHSDLEHDDF